MQTAWITKRFKSYLPIKIPLRRSISGGHWGKKKLYKPQICLHIEVGTNLINLIVPNTLFILIWKCDNFPDRAFLTVKVLSISPNVQLAAHGLTSFLLQLLTYVQLSLTSWSEKQSWIVLLQLCYLIYKNHLNKTV